VAYIEPTAGDLLARYPELESAGTDLGYVDLVMAEANAEVGPTWIEGDRKAAALSLAAHRLYAYQQVSLTGLSGGAVSGPITRETVGPLSVQYNKIESGLGGGSAASPAALNASPYGARYLELRRRSFPAVAVV
jgi:hypothetical protein